MVSDWCRAIGRSATAYTSAIFPATPAARSRGLTCPMAGSEEAAPRSSSRRPTGRNARAPDRHIRNRSADGGSENRPAMQACSDRLRSSRAPTDAGRYDSFAQATAYDGVKSLRCRFAGALCLDLADGIDHGVKGEQRRGVAGFVIAHRFEHRDVGPYDINPPSSKLQSEHYILHCLRQRLATHLQAGPKHLQSQSVISGRLTQIAFRYEDQRKSFDGDNERPFWPAG